MTLKPSETKRGRRQRWTRGSAEYRQTTNGKRAKGKKWAFNLKTTFGAAKKGQFSRTKAIRFDWKQFEIMTLKWIVHNEIEMKMMISFERELQEIVKLRNQQLIEP
jgi:hypothetical protein